VAVTTVLRTPDDGRERRSKHAELSCSKINMNRILLHLTGHLQHPRYRFWLLHKRNAKSKHT